MIDFKSNYMRLSRMIRIIIICLLLCGTAQAADKNNWTWYDYGLQAASTTLLAMDWAQSLHGARHSYRNIEVGFAPSTEGKINSYFATALALNFIIPMIIDRPYRTGFQVSIIAIEYPVVQKNRRQGIGISFHF